MQTLSSGSLSCVCVCVVFPSDIWEFDADILEMVQHLRLGPWILQRLISCIYFFLFAIQLYQYNCNHVHSSYTMTSPLYNITTPHIRLSYHVRTPLLRSTYHTQRDAIIEYYIIRDHTAITLSNPLRPFHLSRTSATPLSHITSCAIVRRAAAAVTPRPCEPIAFASCCIVCFLCMLRVCLATCSLIISFGWMANRAEQRTNIYTRHSVAACCRQSRLRTSNPFVTRFHGIVWVFGNCVHAWLLSIWITPHVYFGLAVPASEKHH